MTFMIHPLHGANVVSPSEVAEQEKNGWIVSTPEHWKFLNGKGPKVEEAVEAPAVAPVRRGRPPKAE